MSKRYRGKAQRAPDVESQEDKDGGRPSENSDQISWWNVKGGDYNQVVPRPLRKWEA